MKKQFKIDGRAVPKARPRLTRSGYAYTPKTTREYEEKVKKAFLRQCGSGMFPESAPLAIFVEFGYVPPKSWSDRKKKKAKDKLIYPTTRPDVDNLIKSIEDALNGVAYKDDSQIIALTARKVYAPKNETKVMIWSLFDDGDK